MKILHRRPHRHNTQTTDQILVQWFSWPEQLATWEDEQVMRSLFPKAAAWGQAGSHGGRNVTTLVTSTTEEDGQGGIQAPKTIQE
jgi:hypothetical protein